MILARRALRLAGACGIALAGLVLAAADGADAQPAALQYDTLSAVACTGPTSCTAVGTYEGATGRLPLAERWRGSSWTVQATPNREGLSSGLLAVSCPSQATCMAIGTGFDSDGFSAGLVEESADGTWRLERSPNPFGARFSTLDGVSCWKAGHCMAVGSYAVPSGFSDPLAELWSGAKFRALKPPNPSNATSGYPVGVACVSAASCVAVGSVTLRSGANVPAAYGWNGTRWRALTVPRPASTTAGALNGVSCTSPVICYAVGTYYAGGQQYPFAESLRSGTWHLMRVPAVPGTTGDRLLGVDCAAKSACMSAGFAAGSRGNTVPVIATLRGVTWRALEAPEPAGTDPAGLYDVSCVRQNSCIAVGEYESTAGLQTLAESWNGASWRILTTSNR
jgi:hypothetical protein